MSITHNEKKTPLQALFYISIWAILCPFSAYGQGLITSNAVDTTPPQYFELLEKGGTSLPTKVSLRQYCPKPADQGYGNTCVAFACGHAAMTITKQAQLPKKNIKDNPYSAEYIYRNIYISKGIEFDTVLNFMKRKGICRVDKFKNLTDERKLMAEAEQNKIDWDKLFTKRKDLDYVKVLNTLKNVIADSFPIILGVNIINKDFQKLRQMKWEPLVKIKDTLKHAMVIVGYDDNTKTFDLMNSRGIGWGNGGFIQLAYADFERVFESAYILGKRKYGSRGDNITDSLSSTIDSTRTALTGTFQLKKAVKIDTSSPNFHAQPLQFSEKPTESAYETKERFPVNSQFQLHVRDIPEDKKLYVFSFDEAGVVTVHGQPDTLLEQKKQLISVDNVLIIPSPKTAIGVKYRGKDQFIMLISDSIITNFNQQLDAFRAKKGTAQARLEAVFGDALLPTTAIDYLKSDDTTMSIKSRVWRPAKQGIVSIILDIRTVN